MSIWFKLIVISFISKETIYTIIKNQNIILVHTIYEECEWKLIFSKFSSISMLSDLLWVMKLVECFLYFS